MPENWRVLVEPMPREEAERAFAEWREREAARGRFYSGEYIRMDIIRWVDGRTRVRYLVPAEWSDY